MFIDKVRVHVKGGDGGKGCLSFLHEKFNEFGGPDGGNGGDGGDVYLEASSALTTLLDCSHHPHVRGRDGAPGKGGNKDGLKGEEIIVKVPVGTVVYRDGVIAADLAAPGQRFLAAAGGRGGRGNLSFKSRFNTAPRLYERGAPGERSTLELELKLIADVGVAGLPNAGKSTLLSRLTHARPKIADYPFTTLSPNLGVAAHKGVSFVIADIPGLIEGASGGRGLGHEFLRHIERTRVLVHLIDPMGFGGRSAVEGIKVIEAELKSHGARLAAKPRILVVNKLDLPGADEILRKIKARHPGRPVLGVSAVTGAGLGPLLDRLILELSRHPAPGPLASPETTRFVRVDSGFSVSAQGGGRFLLSGQFVERAAAQLDASLPEAVERFQKTLKRIGVDRALKRAGIREGDMVRCGELEFEWTEAPARRLPRVRHKRTRIGVGKS